MPEIVLPQRFAQRRGTEAEWAASPTVLYEGEIGFLLDETNRSIGWKVGDGVTPWALLPYFASGGTGGGSVWRNGTGAPADTLGADGDYYLETVTGDVYKRESDAYTVVTNIKGPQGNQGLKGDKGNAGTNGRSAYQEAVFHGFIGSELEWLASLVGAAGTDAVGAASRTTVSFNQGEGSIATGQTALLLHLAINSPARLRLYGTSAARTADASRLATVASPPGAGLLLEYITTVSLLGSPLTPGIIAANHDVTPTGVLYYNLEPLAGSTASATLTYLKLET